MKGLQRIAVSDARDNEILRLRSEGLTYSQIADVLGTKVSLVCFRIDRMKRRGVVVPERGRFKIPAEGVS